jgi:hypothetical protein
MSKSPDFGSKSSDFLVKQPLLDGELPDLDPKSVDFWSKRPLLDPKSRDFVLDWGRF